MSPLPRFHRLDPDRRESLLEAAGDEFAARGYEAASLNRIIEVAGISKGALYYYFDDKADLFSTVLRHACRLVEGAAPLELAGLGRAGFWRGVTRQMLERAALARQRPWIAGIARVMHEPPSDEAVRRVIAEEFAAFQREFRTILDRGRALGLVREDLPDDLLFAMLSGTLTAADRWMVAHWDDLPYEELEEFSAKIFDGVARMLAPVHEKPR